MSRFWLVFGLVFLLFVAGFTAASWLKSSSGEGVWFFVVLSALPSFYYLVKSAGLRRSVLILFSLSAFSFFVEGFGVVSGFPYGFFSYTDKMGGLVFGLVPWTVPFAWIPLVLASATLAGLFFRNAFFFLAASAVFLVLMNLMIDPAASSVGLWVWSNPGAYYGVPASNFAGWFAAGTVGSTMYYLLSKGNLPGKHQIAPAKLMFSALLMLAFWTGITVSLMLAFPAFLGFLMVGLILRVFYQHRSRGSAV
ncbi:Bisanhydrobacterioruberin hydratase [uncultured archaeon]|nr:Bisanhydrobacterioruberin hydratase [uncultured archaeon]